MGNSNNKNITLEKEIISLLAQGDKKAISLLYQNYSDALYGIIRRTIPSQEVATEVLQDVYVKVWKNRDRYDGTKGKLFTWLAQITRNATIDVFRSGKYQRSLKTDEIDPLVYNSVQLSEESDIRDSGLQDVINKMDPKYYKLIYLVYFEGYSQSEIAEKLDMPLGTVKTRLRSAIKELRKTLGNETFAIIAIGSYVAYLLSNCFNL